MFHGKSLIRWEVDEGTHGGRIRSVFSAQFSSNIQVSFCMIVRSGDSDIWGILAHNLNSNETDRTISEFVVMIPNTMETAGIEELITRFGSDYLRVFRYPVGLEERRLRNQCFQLAKGNILLGFEPLDKLPPRPGSYVFNQMTRSRNENILVLEKKWKKVLRMGIWRTTFYEMRGFDETTDYLNQCLQLVNRAKSYGIPTLRCSNDPYTTTSSKRYVSFFSVKPKQVLKRMSPIDTSILPFTL